MLTWTNQAAHHYNRIIRKALLDTDSDRPTVGEHMIVNSPVEKGQRVVFGNEERVQILEVTNGSREGIDGWELFVKGESETDWLFLTTEVTQVKQLKSEAIRRANAMKREKERILSSGESVPNHVDAAARAAWCDYFNIDRTFNDLRPPHASTVHKAQGSTYQHAFIDLADIGRNTKWHEIARLVYVALTRAAVSVYVTGELPARLYGGEAA